MSISAIQKRRKTKEFQTQLLQKGIEPNSYELNRMITEHFDNHILGMPYYNPIEQTAYEESSKDDYNHNFKTFQEDIETIYEANIEANNKAVAMQEYYDLEKNKVRNAIAKLQLRVENITEALKASSKSKQYVEVFEDLYGSEFYGNASRNIPYTTSFVDLLQKKVYTDKVSSKVNKISMANATIDIKTVDLTSFSKLTSEGEKEKILTDTVSDMYVLVGNSSSDKQKSLSIEIDLGSLTEINMVSFSFTSVKLLDCELFLSDDNENFVSVYKVSNRDFIEWNFNSKIVRYIKIVCIKNEADGITVDDNNATLYQYNYLFKNISIAKEEFESKSVYVSKVIDFDDLTSVIKLDATDMVFNNTRIDYFIGFDNDVDKIGWDAIENHKEHKLFMFQKRHKILNAHIGEEFGTQGTMYHLYKLYELPNTINKNSIKLTAGYNMWSVRRYNRIDGDNNFDEYSLSSGDFSTLVSKCYMTQMFMDCENYDAFPIQTNVLYIFTQYISMETQGNSFDHFIRVVENINVQQDDNNDNTTTAINDINNEIRVFLNGNEVTSNDDKFSFAFKKGVNKMQIAVYCDNANAKTAFLYHNFNFKNLTNDIFGFTPMKYTTNITLEKTIGETYSYYTIKDNWLYVKCNPDDMINSQLEDMGYFLTYSALRNDMVDYFEDNHIKFRLMAILTSNDKNVSPELLNFRLTGK